MHVGIEGQLFIHLNQAHQQVLLQSTRPLTALNRLFTGKTPEQVLTTIPLLFSVCRNAQALAAVSALEQAVGSTRSAAIWQARLWIVQLETGREHLWRLLADNDQPAAPVVTTLIQPAQQLLHQAKQGLFIQGQAFHLGTQLQPQAGTALRYLQKQWQALLEQHLLGMSLPEWHAIQDVHSLHTWLWQSTTPVAANLRALMVNRQAHWGTHSDIGLQASVLSRQQDHGLVRELVQTYGNGVLAYQVARLVELCSSPDPADQMLANSQRIPAARGNLRHMTELDDQHQVMHYHIEAPTDINFHPDGVVVKGLQALLKQQLPTETLYERANSWIQAVDPCVAYQLECR